jgi:hypothetical protein
VRIHDGVSFEVGACLMKIYVERLVMEKILSFGQICG